jgi:glucosyl-3-phosphoglycerate phosphatase
VTGAPVPSLPVRRLLLWRHGQTEWNITGRFQGQLDPPLDDEGRRQAASTAPDLLATGLSAGNTVVVTSDLSRAVDTASVLTGLLGVPLLQDPRLREHGMGCWEGLTRDEVAERFPDQYADWISGRPVRGRGGEEPGNVGERAFAALLDLPAAEVAVVVTHGGTAGRLIERLLNLGPEHRRVFGPLTNCAWSELVVQGSRWRVMRHNNAGAPVGRSDGGRPDAGASPEEGGALRVGDADAVL